MADRHKRRTARSFGDHAGAYRHSSVHEAGADLEQLADWCDGTDCALDVATGAGHTAGALSRAGVDTVIAADAAPEMVAVATETFPVAGLVADAERLPLASETVDAVTCRIAAHHFPNPDVFVGEVVRVLRPGGVFALEDNVAPDDERLDDFLNRLERLRDPTHVRSATETEWRDRLEDAGLTVEATERMARTINVPEWLDTLDVPPDRRDRIQALLADPPAGASAHFGLERSDGTAVSFQSPKLLVRARR